MSNAFPRGHADERELFLDWLRYLRGAVIAKVEDLTEEQARWRPEGALICLLGIVNHLTHVEWRWIDGALGGAEVDAPPPRQRDGAPRRPRRRHAGASRRAPGHLGPQKERT